MSQVIKSSIICLAFYLLAYNAQAQVASPNKNDYWQGIVALQNGDTLSGLVKVPYDPVEKKLKFRSSEEESAIKIEIDNIKSVIVMSDSGYVYQFEPYPIKVNPKKDSIKKNKRKYFLLVYASGEYATFYKVASYYSTGNDGRIYVISEYSAGATMPYITYCIRKKDNQFVDIFAETSPSKTVFGLDRMFRNRSKTVLADDPKLLEKILNKELQLKDLDFIIEMYLNDMAGK